MSAKVLTTFGQRLRHARKLAFKLTASELSVLIGSYEGHVSNLENDKKLPSFGTLVALSTVLGASLDWLCKGVGLPRDGKDGCPRLPQEEVRDAVQQARALASDHRVAKAAGRVRKRRHKLTTAQGNTAIRMHRAGASPKVIAGFLKVHTTTVSRLVASEKTIAAWLTQSSGT